MYLPIESQAAAITVPTVIAPTPTPFLTEIAGSKEIDPPELPPPKGPICGNDQWYDEGWPGYLLGPLNSEVPDTLPDFPNIFVPVYGPDYSYDWTDDVDRCLGEAVQYVGRERFLDFQSEDGWKWFLKQSKDQGLVGTDTNKDRNDVRGLAYQVKGLAKQETPPLNPATDDFKTCLSAVKKHTTDKMLEEILLSWAAGNGHLDNLIIPHPDLATRDAEADAIPPPAFEHPIPLPPPEDRWPPPTLRDLPVPPPTLKDDPIPLPSPKHPLPGSPPVSFEHLLPYIINVTKIGESHGHGVTPHLPRSMAPAANSAYTVQRVDVGVDNNGLPARLRFPPYNFTVPFNWTINGSQFPSNTTDLKWTVLEYNVTLTSEGTPAASPSLVPPPKPHGLFNSALLPLPPKPEVDARSVNSPEEERTRWIPHPDTQYPNEPNAYVPNHLDRALNRTSQAHGNSTLHERRVAGRSSDSTGDIPDAEGSHPKDVYTIVAKNLSINDPEIFALFGNSKEKVIKFYDNPDINESLQQAISDVTSSKHGIEVLSKFLKNFVERHN